MGYRNANYSAFYVAEPFNPNFAYSAKDFCYYQTLKMWKENDSSFPFVDAHDKTYSVRDGSDWEKTLKPRLHERLRQSANVVLFLSSNTKYSRALHEEIDYAINTLELPIIVVYPDFVEDTQLFEEGYFSQYVKSLWNKIPVFKKDRNKVPVLHVSMNKYSIAQALQSTNFRVANKTTPGDYKL